MTPSHVALLKRGWTVERSESPILLPDSLQRRYRALPTQVVDWLSSVSVCCNSAETAWFLSADDYFARSGGFQWNTCELMALDDACLDAERERIGAFWDRHFPFALSVHSDYDYFAVDLASREGAVVHGCAPEWEQPNFVSSGFGAFLAALERQAERSAPDYPFSLLFDAQA